MTFPEQNPDQINILGRPDFWAMRTADFDYALPPELIAQAPAVTRDQSRLLVIDRAAATLAHKTFPDLLDYLRPGDLLALNDSRVIPARLRGRNAVSGGSFEILLLAENGTNDWWAMLRPGKRARIGTWIDIMDADKRSSGMTAQVLEINDEGHRRLSFSGVGDVLDHLDVLGEIPLPPYIERPSTRSEDRERYQTVYAQASGSVAAPTAGLHFTRELLDRVRAIGVRVCFVTLHVGPGTFAPVKAEFILDHLMHEERFWISAETANAINEVKKAGTGRIVVVGTTTLRVLESVAQRTDGAIVQGMGKTRIFIHPPHPFKVADAMVTNFHLPCSTLLMLVSAFAAPGATSGRETILRAYSEAIRLRYRFFSYGDAMLII